MHKNLFIFMVISLLSTPLSFLATIQSTIHYWPGNDHECGISLRIEGTPGEYIYKDYLTVTCDNPQIAISLDAIKSPLISHFDADFNETKKAFEGAVDLMLSLSGADLSTIDSANLHVCYYRTSEGKMIEEIVPLIFEKQATLNDLATQIDVADAEIETASPNQKQTPQNASWLSWITGTIEHSNSWIFRIILIFLLGILMSLTPCIYPMIPITAGILQTQESRSLLMSFLLALSYTFGLATTFAILGLLAAFAGQAMGQLMYHPGFIIPLVALLIYLAFSMMGFYELYIPRFLQPQDHHVKAGSFLSVFLFGLLSGAVASPCLSPGLVCLLCMVTTWGSALLGFIVLFAFGLGLSIPLLIIGTFSNSLSLMPRAGMWMVEIKKIFGVLMLFMCVYFLQPLFSKMPLIIALAIAIIVIGGILFLYFARHAHTLGWRIFYNLLGIATIAFSVYFTYATYFLARLNLPIEQSAAHHTWSTQYQSAREIAQKNNKKMFVDIGAPYCSICKSIDAKLLHNPLVEKALFEKFVPVKVNGGDSINDSLLQKFHVMGFPTILLIDPTTETIIKRWGPELNETKPKDFIKELNNVI